MSADDGVANLALTVGTRVVVRYRLEPESTEPGGPHLSDAVGELVDVAGDAVVIRTRRGDVRVPHHAVVLAKRVPPPPSRC